MKNLKFQTTVKRRIEFVVGWDTQAETRRLRLTLLLTLFVVVLLFGVFLCVALLFGLVLFSQNGRQK